MQQRLAAAVMTSRRNGTTWSRFRRGVSALAGFACLALPLATPAMLVAQVGSIATTPPVLSPVGLWRSVATSAELGALANTLTVRINSGATQTIPAVIDNVINAFPSPISITTEWQLSGILTAVDLVGYFASPTAALSTTGSNIASSRILGRVLTGRATSFAPFTDNGAGGLGTPGASLHLLRQFIIGPINGTGRRTDNLELQLDLRGQPKLPVGTYRGTLTLRAIAY